MLGFRICAWFLCLSMAVNASYGLCRGDESGGVAEGECFVELFCCEEGDVVEITLKAECQTGVCGAFAILEYSAESYALISCGAEAGGLTFSYRDGFGRIILLFDGVQECESILVRFYFERMGRENGGVFRVGEFQAYGISDEAGLCEVFAEIVCGEIRVEGEGEEKERNAWVESVILQRREDRKNEAVICGGISGDFFAAGFKVFIIELESFKYETVYISSVLASGEERLEWRISTDFEGDISIVVTPIGYGRELFEGEKRVSVFLK